MRKQKDIVSRDSRNNQSTCISCENFDIKFDSNIHMIQEIPKTAAEIKSPVSKRNPQLKKQKGKLVEI